LRTYFEEEEEEDQKLLQPRPGLQIPRWLGSDPLSAWWLGLVPDTLEFWVRFPNERNQGKQAPCVKVRRKMETPMVGWRLGAVHEDVGLAIKRRSFGWKRSVLITHT